LLKETKSSFMIGVFVFSLAWVDNCSGENKPAARNELCAGCQYARVHVAMAFEEVACHVPRGRG